MMPEWRFQVSGFAFRDSGVSPGHDKFLSSQNTSIGDSQSASDGLGLYSNFTLIHYDDYFNQSTETR